MKNEYKREEVKMTDEARIAQIEKVNKKNQ